MSGSTIGGVVGGAVGFFVGGPAGAQWGWMIGSAVGGYVDPTRVEGPRLSDARSQTSRDGVPIPFGWGTFPVMGNVIWQQPDITEHENTDDGKGSGTEQVTYSYTRSYAIGICEGPIAGLLIIKRNGKIVYDSRDDATLEEEYTHFGMTTAEALARITGQRAENAKFIDRCAIYLGDETQNPDPTIESYKGVGNVPSYRGLAYIVVTDDETAAGEIAQYEFVVAKCGTSETVNSNQVRWLIAYASSAGSTMKESETGDDWTGAGFIPDNPSGWAAGSNAWLTYHNGSVLAVSSNPGTGPYGIFRPSIGASWETTDLAINASAGDSIYSGGYWFVATAGTPGARSSDGVTFDDITGWEANAMCVVGSNILAVREVGTGWVYRADVDGGNGERVTDTPETGVGNSTSMASSAGMAGVIKAQGMSGAYDAVIQSTDDIGETWEVESNPFPTSAETTLIRPKIIHDSTLGMWFVTFFDRLAYGASLSSLTLSAHVFPGNIYGIDSDGVKVIVCGEGGMLQTATEGDYQTWTAKDTGGVNTSIYAVVAMTDSLTGTPIPDAPGYVVDDDGVISGPPTTTVTPCGTVTLQEIADELCARSGLDDDEYDFSQQSGDIVPGMMVARETDAASIIATIFPQYQSDPAEWDAKVRGIKRGGTAVASINGDDLVERDGDAFERERVQEAELLRRVTVNYIDPSASYGPTTQKWERRAGTVQARAEASFELPLTLDKDTAATMAKRRGLTAWGEPEKQKFSLPYRLAALTPTDVINYTDDDGEIHSLRIMQAEDDSGIRYMESASNCAEAYNATASGVAPLAPMVTALPTLRGPTDAVYMNLPSLRTQDNVPGVTIAAAGVLAGWTGATIMLSADGGVSYQEVVKFTSPSGMGRLTASCTSSSEPIAVQMTSGATLASITDEQLALRQNAFAITSSDVSELGQFKTATAVGSDAYDLTDAVRGSLGTTAASHASGDRFVMVSTARFVPLDISLAGRTLYFKAVTFGTSADAAEAVQFVFSPLFTSVTVDALTVDGSPITVDGQPIYVVT